MESNWFKNNYKSIIRISYIIPILVAAGISIFHVINWYDITNPISWAIYLSIGIEIAALSALAGMTAKMNKWVYVPFFIVTFIQLLGNIYASYSYIDINAEGFKSWVELFNPMFESFGWVKNGDLMTHKRILGILGGVFIPLISLSFLHLLISFNDKIDKSLKPVNNNPNNTPNEGINEEINNQHREEIEQPKTDSKSSILKNKKKEPTIKDKQLEVDFSKKPKDDIKPEKKLKNKKVDKNKREAVIPTGKVQRDEIPEIKDRGFSVKIPKLNNSIQRIGKDNNMGKMSYKRGKNEE